MRPSTAVKLLVAPYQPSNTSRCFWIALIRSMVLLDHRVAEEALARPCPCPCLGRLVDAAAARRMALGAVNVLAAVAAPGIGNLAALAVHLGAVSCR